MRLSHYERLRPVCPSCRARGEDVPLHLQIELCEEEDVAAGVLRCGTCGQAFPIISGVPILMPDLAGWLANNLHLMLQADIAGAAAEAVVGALAGPDSAFNLVRQQQSTYGESHYGTLDEGETTHGPEGAVSLLQLGLDQAAPPSGPVLDMGCAVGGTSFALCDRADDLVLGVDVNWPLLKIARQARETGWVRYPLRRGGVTYDRRTGRLMCAHPERADFWIADALALPFATGTFAQVVGLNLIDCVADPARMVREVTRMLAPEGRYLLSTPFDWASHATPPHLWLAGPEALTQMLTENGLVLDQIHDANWRLHLHDHSTMTYRVKFFTGQRGGPFL